MPEGGEPKSKFANIFHQISLYNKLKKRLFSNFMYFLLFY